MYCGNWFFTTRIMTTDFDWSELHHDLLNLIGKKIKLIQDFMSFGLVCKSWHAAAATKKPPTIPLLLLPEKEKEDDIRSRRLYSLSKGKILDKNLYLRKAARKKCFGLKYGWILTVSFSGKMHLLQPLSGSEIKLPHQKSIYKYKEHLTLPPYTFTCKAALSANPSESLDFVLMITYGSGGMCIGYWRPGDKAWTCIEFHRVSFSDLITYQDRFYLLVYDGSIWSCQVSKNEHKVCKVTEPPPRKVLYHPKFVESAGALLVFDRELIRILEVPSTKLKLYEINLIEGVWKRILCLGDRAIFVGNNTTFCLDKASEFSGIKSNHIYCTDDLIEEYMSPIHEREQYFGPRKGSQEMGHYCLEDAKITSFDIKESLSDMCPPFWFLPSL